MENKPAEFEEGEIDEDEWLKAAATNSAFDFLEDPEEDVYTPEGGKPLSEEE